MKIPLAAALALAAALLPAAVRAQTLERAARDLSVAASAAGLRRIAVSGFDGSARGAQAAERLTALLVREARVTVVERARLPELAGLAGCRGDALRDAQALVIGSVIVENGRARLTARLVAVETGVILAASEADLEGAPAAAPDRKASRRGLFALARTMFEPGDNYGPGHAEAVDRLAAVSREAEGRRRAAAVLALGSQDGARPAGLVAAALEDPAPNVRAAAALALGVHGGAAAEARLPWVAAADPDEDVRKAAEDALAHIRLVNAVADAR